MRICYHGTNKQNARSILKEGFRPDTWFARNVQDAIGYGGNHVFEVVFDNPPDDWQFHVLKKIEPDRIVRYMIYRRKLIFENAELSGKIFSAAIQRVRNPRSTIESLVFVDGREGFSNND